MSMLKKWPLLLIPRISKRQQVSYFRLTIKPRNGNGFKEHSQQDGVGGSKAVKEEHQIRPTL